MSRTLLHVVQTDQVCCMKIGCSERSRHLDYCIVTLEVMYTKLSNNMACV